MSGGDLTTFSIPDQQNVFLCWFLVWEFNWHVTGFKVNKKKEPVRHVHVGKIETPCNIKDID